MNIVFEKNIDWEPLHIKLSPVPDWPDILPTMRREVGEWLSRRDAERSCGNDCTTKYFDLRGDGDAIRVLVQWACDTCARGLLEAIASKHPEIKEASVGLPPEPSYRVTHDRNKFVTVAFRAVTLENGATVEVGPFEISRFPVGVVQYEEFAVESGYLTSAEVAGKPHTYRRNGTLCSPEVRKTAGALFLSQVDALEYCKRKGFRLPTDLELLAAITVDDLERTLSSEERASLFRDRPEILRAQGNTITATREGELAVVRSGPWVTKHPEWNQPGRYRIVRLPTDPVGQMYVVKL